MSRSARKTQGNVKVQKAGAGLEGINLDAMHASNPRGTAVEEKPYEMKVGKLIKQLVEAMKSGNMPVKFLRVNKGGETWAYSAGSIGIEESPHDLGEKEIVVSLVPESDGQDNDMAYEVE